MNTFKEGSFVRLKSGSPTLTVMARDRTDRCVNVAWIDENGQTAIITSPEVCFELSNEFVSVYIE